MRWSLGLISYVAMSESTDLTVKPSTCHPTRRAFVRGMCQACYQRPYVQRHRQRQRERRTLAGAETAAGMAAAAGVE